MDSRHLFFLSPGVLASLFKKMNNAPEVLEKGLIKERLINFKTIYCIF